MKLTMVMIAVIGFIFSTCAEQQNKTEQVSFHVQSQTPVIKNIQIPVHGMTCSACQGRVKKIIKSLPGVIDAEVSLENKMAFIEYDSLIIEPGQIQKAINKDGYQAGNPEVDKE